MTVSSQRFYLPIPQIFTDQGILAPGWKLYFYETGSTTPKAVYSNTGLSAALPNPVLTNDEGHLIDGSNNITSVYFSDASLYKAILKDENDVEQWTADPCDPFTVSLATLSPRPVYYAGVTTGTSTAYVLDASPPYTSYSSTDTFELTFHTACGATPTLKYVADGVALNLKKYTGVGTKSALAAGDVQNQTYLIRNDGTDVMVLGITPSSESAPGIIPIATQAETNTGTNDLKTITPLKLAAKPGLTVQVVNTETGAVATGSTNIPFDDTIPQITEGDQFMSLAITPTNTNNHLLIQVITNFTNDTGGQITTALFQDSIANALAATTAIITNVNNMHGPNCLNYFMTAGTTSSTTFKVRIGASGGGTTTFNGTGGSRKFGGVMSSSITITEIKA